MGVDLVEVSVADIVNLFPNAMMIRFLGDSRFESLITINNAEVPEMEKFVFIYTIFSLYYMQKVI